MIFVRQSDRYYPGPGRSIHVQNLDISRFPSFLADSLPRLSSLKVSSTCTDKRLLLYNNNKHNLSSIFVFITLLMIDNERILDIEAIFLLKIIIE